MNALHLLAALILAGVALLIGCVTAFAFYSIRLQEKTDNWVSRWNEAAATALGEVTDERREEGQAEQETTALVPEV